MATQPYQGKLAGGVTNTNFDAPFELFAGESEIVTDQGQAGPAAIVQFTVLGRIAGTGRLVKRVATAVDGSQNAVGIAAQPAAANAYFPLYVGGVFNHEALVWDAADDTLAERKAAFDGTNIGVRQLL